MQECRQQMGPGTSEVQPCEWVSVSGSNRGTRGLHHDPGGSAAALLQGGRRALQDRYQHSRTRRPISRMSHSDWRSCVTPGKKSHLRKTTEKKPPTKETIAKLQQSNIWMIENEFYEFALEHFQFVRAHAVREKDGELYVLAQSFFYEKIYPKWTETVCTQVTNTEGSRWTLDLLVLYVSTDCTVTRFQPFLLLV